MRIFKFIVMTLLVLSFSAEMVRAQGLDFFFDGLDDFESVNLSDADEGFSDLLEQLDCYEEADEDGDGEPDKYDEESGYYADCDEDENEDED